MTLFTRIGSNLTDLAKAIFAVIIGVLLSIVILIQIGNEPGHDDLLGQQQMILDQQRVMLCLMLYPEEQRQNPEVLSSCQSSPLESQPGG